MTRGRATTGPLTAFPGSVYHSTFPRDTRKTRPSGSQEIRRKGRLVWGQTQSASPNACALGMPARKEVGGRGRGGSAAGCGHLRGRSGGQRRDGPRHGGCKPNLKTKQNKKSKNTDRRMPEPEALDSISFQMFSQQENRALLLPPQTPSSIKTPSIGEIQTEPLSLKQGGENPPSRPWDTPHPGPSFPGLYVPHNFIGKLVQSSPPHCTEGKLRPMRGKATRTLLTDCPNQSP